MAKVKTVTRSHAPETLIKKIGVKIMDKAVSSKFAEYRAIEVLNTLNVTPENVGEVLKSILKDFDSLKTSKNEVLSDFGESFDAFKYIELIPENESRIIDGLNVCASCLIPVRLKVSEKLFPENLREVHIESKEYTDEELYALSGLDKILTFKQAKESFAKKGEDFKAWLQGFKPKKQKPVKSESQSALYKKGLDFVRGLIPNLVPAEYSVYSKKAEEEAGTPLVGINWHWSSKLKGHFVQDLLQFDKAFGLGLVPEAFEPIIAKAYKEYKELHEVKA